MKSISSLLAAVVFIMLSALPQYADWYKKNENIDILKYSFSFKLNEENDMVVAETTIQARVLSGDQKELALDFAASQEGRGFDVLAVYDGNEPVPFSRINDKLIIRFFQPALAGGVKTLRVAYRGVPKDGLIIGPNLYGEKMFCGDNWPERARCWLPVVDHPYDKAQCEFIIDAPEKYSVIANGILQERSSLPGGRALTRWLEEKPIPTKVMVMAAGRFASEFYRSDSGYNLESWLYPQDREPGFAVFHQSGKCVDLFSALIAPLPYAKLAHVQSKTVQGGMENAGCIFYYEKVARAEKSREGLIVHETAHQWFGDSISEKDWNHVWISEGFATYFTAVYFEKIYGAERLPLSMKKDRDDVFRYAVAHPDSRIVDERRMSSKGLLSTNTYQKGGWVLHMLRELLGDEVFFRAIREYYLKFAHGNVVSVDFQQAIEKTSGQQLAWFFKQWLYQPGYPQFRGIWKYNKKKQTLVFDMRQVQQNGFLFSVPLQLAIYRKDQAAPTMITIQLSRFHDRIESKIDFEPERIVPDPFVKLLAEVSLSMVKH
jgi:aminopeptidase N